MQLALLCSIAATEKHNSDLHELYHEESGNPKGNPVLVVHGGPGGGVAPFYRQFFDPAAYRIIMFDQVSRQTTEEKSAEYKGRAMAAAQLLLPRFAINSRPTRSGV